ncbi:MAG: PhzF family phenazine biosynthesis protein [Deltaproteobacteria bacterium]|nr:PhzF family phenazine biosynthesis protein [Deltaproteobacteria bacterium]MBW2153201.1 PhzF family phenazine biosynthesis protein [Deltaproteobacteria bacterium]
MHGHPFKQVDVFTSRPFFGNPVAVVFNADDIPENDMQRIARWTNLSETTFLCSSKQADYRLRIFTPSRELSFAGHPTIGSAHAAREAGLIPSDRVAFTQECLAGLIPLHVDSSEAILAKVPRPKILPDAIDVTQLTSVLGAPSLSEPYLIDVGPVWLVTRVERFDMLYSMMIDLQKLAAFSREVDATGVTVYAIDDNCEVHVRSFAPLEGVPEDPVCGSGNAAVAAHIKLTGLHEITGFNYTARQGAAMKRDGHVQVGMEADDVFIGGYCVTTVDGTIYI